VETPANNTSKHNTRSNALFSNEMISPQYTKKILSISKSLGKKEPIHQIMKNYSKKFISRNEDLEKII
jgi:hypothetical protein